MPRKLPLLGVPQSGYAIERNVPPVDGFKRVRPWDVHRLKAAMRFAMGKDIPLRDLFTWGRLSAPRVDVLHFFNTTSLGRTPWLVTYEGWLPRWGWDLPADEVNRGLDCLMDDPCKGVIAFSQITESLLANSFAAQGRERDFDEIASKRHVLYPPQALLHPRQLPTGPIQCAFVGGDFYRKGGLETLQAFERLFDAGMRDWQLTLVGRLDSWGDYASNTQRKDQHEAERILHRCAANMQHHRALPNADIMELLSRSHYLLFPTFQDTFGYVTLEAMAAGCVPIATRSRSIPELIEHGIHGFLIDVPVNAFGDAFRMIADEQGKRFLVNQLEALLRELLQTTYNQWSKWSANGRERIREQHDPASHSEKLKELYVAALS